MQKNAKQEASDHLEVTGVSRSGRVCKKSSKLIDFESPDEINPHHRRRVPSKRHIQTAGDVFSSNDNSRVHGPPQGSVARTSPKALSQSKDDEEEKETEEEFIVKNEPESSMESGSDAGGSEEKDGEEKDEGGAADDMRGSQNTKSKENDKAFSQATSLYMLEKLSKNKLIVPDEKIVGQMKARRKGKGKPRFSAYMLWAKDVRRDIRSKNRYMDFGAISKRLAELWAKVPTNQKFNWRRRAKRLNARLNQEEVK